MTRGLSSMTIPASGGDTQVGSSADGASGCVWLVLGGRMGSFGNFWFGEGTGGAGWRGENGMPASL
jgi:hypothetical protein